MYTVPIFVECWFILHPHPWLNPIFTSARIQNDPGSDRVAAISILNKSQPQAPSWRRFIPFPVVRRLLGYTIPQDILLEGIHGPPLPRHTLLRPWELTECTYNVSDFTLITFTIFPFLLCFAVTAHVADSDQPRSDRQWHHGSPLTPASSSWFRFCRKHHIRTPSASDQRCDQGLRSVHSQLWALLAWLSMRLRSGTVWISVNYYGTSRPGTVLSTRLHPA